MERARKTFAGDIDVAKSDPELAPTGLHAKMAYIMANMGSQKPEGKNPHFRYAYWSTDQVTGYFRSMFGRLGISFTADVESWDIREHQTAKEGRSYLTTVLVRYTLTDTDTGDMTSGVGIGQGDDPGDKGSNKAMAGALKYWLLKTFLMGGEDAEADENTDKRAEAPERREERPVTVGPSNIEGIGRGGRANMATEAQIRQMRLLARDLHWLPDEISLQVDEILGEEYEMPEDVADKGPAILRRLEGLSADDAGKVITAMVERRDAATENKEPSDDPYADGPYGY